VIRPRDPYRLADVYLPPELEEYVDFFDEQEWSGTGNDWEVLQKGMTAQAHTRYRQYLAMNGAAVWRRIDRASADARLQREVHPGASIVAAVTAAELLVRFFLVRPMIAGLVFNTRLAMRLVPRAPINSDGPGSTTSSGCMPCLECGPGGSEAPQRRATMVDAA
jgi:hypothetical protein